MSLVCQKQPDASMRVLRVIEPAFVMLYPEATYPRNGKAFPSALGWGFRNVSRSNHRIPGKKIGKHDRYQ